MDLINETIGKAAIFLPLLGTVALVVTILLVVDRILKQRWKDKPDAQFRFQLIMLALTFTGILTVIVALPINDVLRGQLLSLIGILLSAAIALSSTTFIGNIMAGIMLKAVKNARPGDFITVSELTGRITEMGLLHTEIQTEFRDLVTVPNLYMVTQPMQVVRASGTIISAEVSLGYEVSHNRVAETLLKATEQALLKEGFVQVRQLGDFSVTYRVAGLLEDVKSLISARSALREAILDQLHSADIEIVSPNFMNTRVVAEGQRFIPEPSHKVVTEPKKLAEDVAFDKADAAASVEDIRKAVELIELELARLKDASADLDTPAIDELKAKQASLLGQLKDAEEQQKESDVLEQSSAAKPD